MPFDNSTRNRLQRLVSDCRDLLTREFDAKLKELYGIYADEGRVLDLEKLATLDDEKLRVASLLRERINHLASAGGGSPVAIGEAVKRVLREQAFTVLNRFAALRMAEERGIIVESVGGGLNSKGFKTYSEVAHSGLGSAYERYRVFLGCMFDEMATDLGVLFDRRSPYGLLFPRENVLLEMFGLLNAPEVKPLWKEDETVGWIYQYFNDPAERKKMRELSAAPRNSRELAVRNQFFTPRYVVEFLTDNTLGRIWYEMCGGGGGATSLREKCRYLVRRPNEMFLKPGETSPAQPKQDNLSQEELLKQPVFIPHRPIKDPRTILMLDPACGSMHFGLYAFDLYEIIYDEAWELEGVTGAPSFARPAEMKSLRETFATKEEFLRQVPRLIIEHNLHGIDIDPRCAQIAGLSLWLRAQRAWKELGIAPAQRPRITRSNIVCAEPMPGEKELLREFVEKEFPAAERGVFLQLLETIFDKMQLAGEAGSLLKIEEEISSAIEAARAAWQKLQTRPAELFSTGEMNAVSKQAELDATADLRLLTSDFFARVEERIYAALRDYAEQAENGGGFQRRLFAEDAARGFAFIDVCRKRYDAVVMNPPFGESSDRCLEYFDRVYPSWNANMLCASLQRGWEMTSINGAVGAIYDRTAIVKSSYEEFRRAILVADDRLGSLADLGWEVLDANVEVTTSVLRRNHDGMSGVFVDVRNGEKEQKGNDLLDHLKTFNSGEVGSSGIIVMQGIDFQQFPNAVIGYDFPAFLRRAFEDHLSLSSSGYSAFTGHQFKTEQHFRLWWETSSLSPPPFFARLFNGAGFCPFWAPLRDVLISQVELDQLPKNSSTNLRNKDQHLKSGVCFGKRGEFFCAHVLPSNHFFSLEGLAIPVSDPALVFEMLGVLNTPLARASLNKFAGQHKTSGYVNLFPYRGVSDKESVKAKVQTAVLALLKAQQFDETLSFFQGVSGAKTIQQLATTLGEAVQQGLSRSLECEQISHDLVITSYGVSDSDRQTLEEFRLRQPKLESPLEDVDIENGCRWFACHSSISSWLGSIFGRWDIRYATGEQAAPELPDPFALLPVCPPGQLQNAQGLPARPEDVPAAYPLKHIPWAGILVDDENHPNDIEARVHEVLKVIWKDQWESIEREACEILGVKSLRDYFRKPTGFFADHLKRYSKSRRQAPIYWPLATASGCYTLWIYYHRLTDQTLFQCVNDFVKPKITEVEGDLSRLTTTGADKPGARAEIERLTILRAELVEFRDELLRVAQLPYKPNLNDGVLITASPLWKLFRLPKWQKDLKACWTALENEEYEWAHLAYTLWPDRVKAVCKKDRSIAIAHGLEALCDVKAPEKKAKKKKKEQMEMEEAE